MALLNVTGQGLVSSGATLEGLSVWSFKMRISKAVLEGLPTDFLERRLLQFQKAVDGSPGDTQRVTVQKRTDELVRLNYVNDVSGSVSVGYVIDLSTLPEYVVIYGHRVHNASPDGVVCGMWTDAGVAVTVVSVATIGQNPLATGAGTGALTLNGDSRNLTIDGLAIYSAPLTGADRYSPPTPSDANIVALWPFTETSGSVAASSVAGPPNMTLTGASWLAGGSWGSPPPVVLTPDGTVSNSNWSGVGAATLHAALASGDADYIESSTNGAVATVSLTDPVPNLTALTSVVVAIRHRVT